VRRSRQEREKLAFASANCKPVNRILQAEKRRYAGTNGQFLFRIPNRLCGGRIEQFGKNIRRSSSVVSESVMWPNAESSRFLCLSLVMAIIYAVLDVGLAYGLDIVSGPRSWFFDPTPLDHSEFDMIQRAYGELTLEQEANFVLSARRPTGSKCPIVEPRFPRRRPTRSQDTTCFRPSFMRSVMY
jgi:hypothetical protein